MLDFTNVSVGNIFVFGDMTYESNQKNIEKFFGFFNNPEIKEIILHITTGGGNLPSSFSFYDYIERSKKPVVGYVNSFCGSAGFMLLQACHRRLATQEAIFKIHSSSHTPGTMTKMEITAYQNLSDQTYSKFISKTISKTNLTISEFEGNFLPLTFLPARDALDYGFIDEILN
jgi:ATP-dependent protease ClpP protease subunit